MSNDTFVEEGYEAPASGGGFTKFEQGENRFRILSSPIMLWVLWADNKVTRIPYNKDQKPAMPTGSNPSVKHAWGLVVWNYATEQIEVMELDKASLITPLLAHSKDADWGHPKNYDVVFTKTGSGKDGTKYAFTAKPHKPAEEFILQAMVENPVDLKQLLVEGGNPFISSPSSAPAQTTTQPAGNVNQHAPQATGAPAWTPGQPVPQGYKVDETGQGLKKASPF